MPRIVLILFGLSLMMAGCQTAYTQSVPISTDPMGANILVDGEDAGTSPANLELTRNQDHIVTISKPGYKQEDVTVKRVYQTETSVLGAIGKGINDASFFKNDAMGLQSGINSLEQDKESGKAYILTPSAVKVKLMPVGGIANAAAPASAVVPASMPAPSAAEPKSIDVLSLMAPFDRELLDRVLETKESGDNEQWTSPGSGWSFTVIPEAAQMKNGIPLRTFKVSATKDGRTIRGTYPAYRENRNDWRIGYPHDAVAGQAETAPINTRAAVFGAAKIATSGLAPVGGSTKLGGSSHSSESMKNGTYTKSTSSTSVKGSVSVDPSAAVDLLEELTRPSGDAPAE